MNYGEREHDIYKVTRHENISDEMFSHFFVLIHYLRDRRIALMMAFHRRLGAESQLKIVTKDIGRYIAKYIRLDMICTLYYTKWCPHCVKVKPEWNKLETKKNHTDICNLFNVNFVSIDCEKNGKILTSNNIVAYPTFLFNVKGSDIKIEYAGDRTCGSFKEFIKNFQTFIKNLHSQTLQSQTLQSQTEQNMKINTNGSYVKWG